MARIKQVARKGVTHRKALDQTTAPAVTSGAAPLPAPVKHLTRFMSVEANRKRHAVWSLVLVLSK